MALHTLSLTGTIPCLAGWQIPQPGTALTPADLAAISDAMIADSDIGKLLQGYSFGPQAVIATGTLNATTAVSAIVARGATPLPVSQIMVGNLVLGVGIIPGTFVQAVSGGGTAVTLSKAATGNAAGVALLFIGAAGQGAYEDLAEITPFGQLFIPNRGILKVLPTDVVGVDNAGNAILVFGNTISYAGSQWTFT